MKTSIFLVLSFLAFTGRMTGQIPTTEPAKRSALIFQARLPKHLFARGEEVAADSAAQQNKLCTVQGEEMEVFASYLKEGIASPQVLSITRIIFPSVRSNDTFRQTLSTLSLKIRTKMPTIPTINRRTYRAPANRVTQAVIKL